MQRSKSRSRNGSSEVTQKTSPVTPRKLKIPASDSDKCPKAVERRSPRSPAAQKKSQTKVSELEYQLAQLQEELKKTKDQLSSSESTAKHAQEEADEAKNELATTSAKLEASQKQLIKISASEQNRSENLEATQNQHSADLSNLRLELTETLSLVEELKCQLRNCEKSESCALERLTETQVKLEIAKTVEENLKDERLKADEAYNFVAFELEKLRTRAEGENEGIDLLMAEFIVAKAEVEQLKFSLDLADKRSQEENIHSNLLIRKANDQAEQMKAELVTREFEMGDKLEKAKVEVEQLKSALDLAERMCKEENIQNTSLMSSTHEKAEQTKAELVAKEFEMGAELERAKTEIEELKAKYVAYNETKNESGEKYSELETELKKLENENEALKAEIERMEMERKREKEEAVALVESAQASEREALIKIGYLTEEADKSNRKAACVVEQLETVQGTNGEMEAELRRLKVQSEQWRKAAEVAAAMISSGRNGKFVERTGSFGKGYNTIGSKLGSPLSEDLDDVLPKKKNGNMLRKLSVLLKKGHK